MKTSLTRFFEEVFCESLLQDFFENVMQNNSLPKENQQSQLNRNWSEKMKDLKGLLKTPIEIEAIDFTEQNVKNLGEFIRTPIECVFLDNIGQESLFHKIKRKSGNRNDIDRRQFLDAIPKVLSNPAFIIEHKPSKDDDYIDDRHLYFKSVELQGKTYSLIFVISLENKNRPKLISFYKADIFDRIKVGDTILYEGGQQTKVILSKG